MLKDGTHVVSIVDYGLTESPKGEPQVAVTFHDQNGDGINWYGSFSEKRKEYTLKDLLTMGLKSNDLLTLEGGLNSGALDTQTQVSIKVETELYNGKSYTKVRYINKLGGAHKFKAIAVNHKATLAAMKGDLMKLRQETGTAAVTQAQAAPAETFADFKPSF